jgi:hypothetical protein
MRNVPILVGAISEGTLRPDHLIVALAAELNRIQPESFRTWHVGREANYVWATQSAARPTMDEPVPFGTEDALEELYDDLDGCAPAGMYFGASEGDGASIGWWLLTPPDEMFVCGGAE